MGQHGRSVLNEFLDDLTRNFLQDFRAIGEELQRPEAPHQHLEHPLKTGVWHADKLAFSDVCFSHQTFNVLRQLGNFMFGPGSPKLWVGKFVEYCYILV